MKLDISKPQTIEFIIEVDGTDIDDVKSRLMLEDNGLMIGVDGISNSQDDGQTKLVFNIPELKNIIKSQKINGKIEMFVENRFYVPYETEIEIDLPVVFKINESKTEPKIPFSVKETTIIEDKSPKESIKTKENKATKPIIENSFNFEKLISEFEASGDFENLKFETANTLANHPIYEQLSEDSKEKIAVLKSKRVKTEELYFKIMNGIMSEMMKQGTTLILE